MKIGLKFALVSAKKKFYFSQKTKKFIFTPFSSPLNSDHFGGSHIMVRLFYAEL
jgi:hypothetical protein